MKHGYITLLDSDLRTLWFGQGHFALSKALFTSARQRVYHKQEMFK